MEEQGWCAGDFVIVPKQEGVSDHGGTFCICTCRPEWSGIFPIILDRLWYVLSPFGKEVSSRKYFEQDGRWAVSLLS